MKYSQYWQRPIISRCFHVLWLIPLLGGASEQAVEEADAFSGVSYHGAREGGQRAIQDAEAGAGGVGRETDRLDGEACHEVVNGVLGKPVGLTGGIAQDIGHAAGGTHRRPSSLDGAAETITREQWLDTSLVLWQAALKHGQEHRKTLVFQLFASDLLLIWSGPYAEPLYGF
jgi:hypothetical protein